MKSSYQYALVFIVLVLFSCKEENQPPVISFVRPATDTLLDQSGTVQFEVMAYDPDGEIQSVEFFFNDDADPSRVEASIPYEAVFDFDSDEHDGTNTITAIAYDFNGGEALARRKVVMSDFRNSWLGSYEGECRFYSKYPFVHPGLYFDPELGEYLYDATANITKPQGDENNHLAITLENDVTSLENWDVEINPNGQSLYFKDHWNQGYYREITWTFEGDSLHIINRKSYYDEGDVVYQYGLKRVY